MQVDQGSWSATAPAIFYYTPLQSVQQPHAHHSGHSHREKQPAASPAWHRVNLSSSTLSVLIFLFSCPVVFWRLKYVGLICLYV